MKPSLEELQALRLIRAFLRLQDPEHRKAVVEYAEAMLEAERG